MSPRELQIEVERRLHRLDKTLIIDSKLSSDFILSFINEAIDKFWKTRYSGVNYKGTGFEQDQKRIDDLRTLVTTVTYQGEDITTLNSELYQANLPEDYAIFLGDTAGIIPSDGTINNCWDKDEDGNYIVHYSDPLEGTIETVDRIKENSLSEFHLKYTKAKPIRLIQGNKILLHTDGQYKVSNYTVQYIRKPGKVTLQGNSTAEYTDLPAHTHMEIVKLAVSLILNTLPNNNIYSTEINAME